MMLFLCENEKVYFLLVLQYVYIVFTLYEKYFVLYNSLQMLYKSLTFGEIYGIPLWAVETWHPLPT